MPSSSLVISIRRNLKVQYLKAPEEDDGRAQILKRLVQRRLLVIKQKPNSFGPAGDLFPSYVPIIRDFKVLSLIF